ncbi:putative hydrolase [Mumia flava]|uniref:Putative hydrolase n=1 Tax=Mumia flava TaxID=1348852 RepID=A0A2M9BFG3_9ACTN|nr:zinc-dependent metalloprotease [Mumia flava]PJJ56634.1 putative hydrolase [Mumia flava]
MASDEDRDRDDLPEEPGDGSSEPTPDRGIGFGKIPGRPGGDAGAGGPAGANPFAGTPMEGLFGAFGGGQMPDMNLLMQQMQRMFAPHDGSVNWELAKDVARQTVAAGKDPAPLSTEDAAVADAVRLADTWLDSVTDLPAASVRAKAWSRSTWVEETMPTWQAMVEPIAAHVVGAMASALPEEAKAMAGPLMGMLSQAGGAMFGAQVGQAVGGLAAEVLSSTDTGLPMGPSGVSAMLPANLRAFAEGLEESEADVFLYAALREAAHQRLYAHAGWLRARILTTVEEFGRGTTIDVRAIEDKLSGFDPTNMQAAQEALAGGLFEPERTPQQQAALDRLEALLAFVEGWVDEVVTQATDGRMPSAVRLREAMRRRRAAGGPAEETFASLVGLELRPRRLRDAAALWAALRDRQGASARDAVWAHPDLMPTAADLDDPIGFAVDDTDATDDSASFDAALADLLDGSTERPDDGGTDDGGADDGGTAPDAGPDAPGDGGPTDSGDR